MAFTTFLPKNELLKKFIAYYYTDGSEDETYRNSYLFYPHINTTVSIYKNAFWKFDGFTTQISFDERTKYLKIVTHQTLPIRVVQTGKTNKIAIVFKPFGLNHFIKENYGEIVRNEAQHFNPINNIQWDERLDKLFTKNSNEEKTEILDNFFIEQYNGYENDLLEKSITMLSDVDNELIRFTIRKLCLLFVIILFVAIQDFAQSLIERKFFSKNVGEDVNVKIWLPENYSKNQ